MAHEANEMENWCSDDMVISVPRKSGVTPIEGRPFVPGISV